MEILNIKHSDLKELEELNMNCNSESTFYIYNNKLIKLYLDYFFGDYINLAKRNKCILNLIKYTKDENIKELLVPEKIVQIDNDFAGILLPRIDGINVSVALKSDNIPLNIKIKILKQIGTILENIKNSNSKYNAAFADVHADNFMVINYNNLSTVRTIAIDTESMKLLDFNGNNNFYYYNNKNLQNLDKYETNFAGLILPSTETDIFCFVHMIIEFIFGKSFYYFSTINNFNKYLDYLDKLGFDAKLLESFASIYIDNTPNINPLPYLDTINNFREKTLKKVIR